MNRADVERMIDQRLSSLTAEIDSLRREIAALRRATGASAAADTNATAGTLTVANRKEVSVVVASTMKAALAGAMELAIVKATEATRRELEPRLAANEAALARTMTHLAYKTDDVETMTRNYQMAALTEAESGSGYRAITGPGSNGSASNRHEIIPGAVRMAFTDDD